MSTWEWLITKPEMVRGRAVSSDSGAPMSAMLNGQLAIIQLKSPRRLRLHSLIPANRVPFPLGFFKRHSIHRRLGRT
jgi:hypothetical protein